jgi:Flp pilus assembly protein TadG
VTLRRPRHGERGQSLAEFALSATALMIFLFGVVVVARGLFIYDLVASGARQGARWAMVRGDGCTVATCPANSTSVKSYVMTKVPGIADATLSVVANFTGSSTAGCTDASQKGRACTVAVTVSYPYTFGYPLKMVTHLASTSTMVMSQ